MTTSVSLRCYAELHEQCNVSRVECACPCHQREPRWVPTGAIKPTDNYATSGMTPHEVARLAEEQAAWKLLAQRLQVTLGGLLTTLTRFACSHVSQREVDEAKNLLGDDAGARLAEEQRATRERPR